MLFLAVKHLGGFEGGGGIKMAFISCSAMRKDSDRCRAFVDLYAEGSV